MSLCFCYRNCALNIRILKNRLNVTKSTVTEFLINVKGQGTRDPILSDVFCYLQIFKMI